MFGRSMNARRRSFFSKVQRSRRRLGYEFLEARELLASDLTGLSVFDINRAVPLVGDGGSLTGDLLSTTTGKLIFPGVTNESGAELQMIDAETLQTTTLEVNPGLADANPRHVTTVGDRVYFTAYDANVGNELRWFNASETNPSLRTIDVNAGEASSDAGEFGGFAAIGNRLFFTATDSPHGTELRWIDMTEATPTLNTIDIWDGVGDSNAGQNGGFTVVGDHLYFSATDGPHGTELRWVHATAEALTFNTLDINEGTSHSEAGRDGGFVTVGSKLFFSATDSLGFEPRWIETTDATPIVNTLVINGAGNSNPDGFMTVGEKVYFWADDDGAFGEELRWVDPEIDVNVVNTLDILEGSRDSKVGQFGGLHSLGDKLFFSADDGVSGLELRWIDTTADIPFLNTIDISSGTSSSNAGELGGFTTVGSRLFFSADDRTNGRELRWLDTNATESMIGTVDLVTGRDDSDAGEFGGFQLAGDKLFFTSMADGSGHRLRWIEASAETPVASVVDSFGGSESSSPSEIVVVGETLYFSARDVESGVEMRWIDADSSTVQSLDIFVGEKNSEPSHLTTVGDKLFFVAKDDDFGEELRWFDTREATPTVQTVNVWEGGGGSGAGEYGGLFQAGDKLYFSASDRDNGSELRWIDTTQTEPILNTLDIELGSGGSRAGRYGGFAIVGDKLFFTADDSEHGHELRWIDTTEETPTLHTLDIQEGSGDSFAGLHGGFAVVDSRLYFTATDSSAGYELRWIDTTLDMPQVTTIDIAEGAEDSRAGRFGGFRLAGDKLYFTADDVLSGSELRWVDARAVTPTFQTVEVNRDGGSFAGDGGGFALVGDRLFFAASDNAHGNELRWIDTTIDSPEINTIDIKLGSESSFAGANGFQTYDEKLFFDADDDLQGTELRWIDTTVIAPVVNSIDIWSGPGGSRGRPNGGFAVFDESLFFAGYTLGFGRELFALDLSAVTVTIPGDLNVDGLVDGQDVDIVCGAIGGPLQVALDFDNNGTHEYADVEAFIRDTIGTELGDANLDGTVNAVDLNQVGVHWLGEGGWSQGDFTCDSIVNAADLNAVGLSWQLMAAPRSTRLQVPLENREIIDSNVVLERRAHIAEGLNVPANDANSNAGFERIEGNLNESTAQTWRRSRTIARRIRSDATPRGPQVGVENRLDRSGVC